MREKLDRLVSLEVNVVHVGICARTEQPDHQLCPTIATLWEELERRNIQVVEGTH